MILPFSSQRNGGRFLEEYVKTREHWGCIFWFYDQFGFSGANMQARLVTQHPTFAGQSMERIVFNMAGSGVWCPEAGTPLAACVIQMDEQGQPIGEPSGSSGSW